jgi:DGQHR domain-containing protein
MPVFAFSSKIDDIQKFAKIDRVARGNDGRLTGFQRPQIANHIKEIADYLNSPGAILPNSIVVAFLSGVMVETLPDGFARLSIDVTNGPCGYIVDGQQRFMALSQVEKNNTFEVLVSGFICNSTNELQKQFILINNTRPLPKALIYELLPRVGGLPDRMASRSTAANLVELLNYRDDSSLRGLIYQQTNPYGQIRDTAVQKVIMNSLSDGALHIMAKENDFLESSFRFLSNFFQAVRNVFPVEWEGKTPKTSRLVHGAGIVSMGFVMEFLHARNGAEGITAFEDGMEPLKGRTAWTEGVWNFDMDDQRKWDSIQYVPRDIRQLSQYLVSVIRKA